MKIAFLGDSITEGVGASSPDKCFVSLVSQDKSNTCLNYGISGTRISKQHRISEDKSWDLYFESRLSAIPKDIDMLFIFGGTNDFGHGDTKLGDKNDTTEDSFCGYFYRLLYKAYEFFPKAGIVVITPLHREGEFYNLNEFGMERKPLIDYVNSEKYIAEKFSVPVIDLYSISNMQVLEKSNKNLYFVDGLHPSDLGHQRIANIIMEYLKK